MIALAEIHTGNSNKPTINHFVSSELVPIGLNFSESLFANGEVVRGSFGCLNFAVDNEKIFGSLNDCAALGLFEQTEKAFAEFFTLMKSFGFNHLWRVWNFIPDINEQENGIERYRIFNDARLKAFSESGYSHANGACASTAVGSHSGKLSICFLAGKVPPINIENPRQTSAFNYSENYSASPPVFSRASLIESSSGKSLLISGTASIIGADTVGINNLQLQAYETLRNIEILISEAKKYDSTIDADSLSFKVYLRDTRDLHEAKEVIDYWLPNSKIVYAEADICRKNLLIEIEAASRNIMGVVYG